MSSEQWRDNYTAEPWQAKEEWASGRIRSHSSSLALVSWVMALLWNGFSWSVVLLLWNDPERQAMVKVLLLFCAVGLLILAWAVHSTLAWFRFGTSMLELAATPGVIGGTMQGRILTRLAQRPTTPVHLTLRCLHRHEVQSTGSSNHRIEVRSDLLWQGGQTVPPGALQPGREGLSIPVHLYIPYGLKSTETFGHNDEITWSLVASCEIPGVDFSAEFTVPVLETAASKPELTQEWVDEQTESAAPLPQPVDRGASWVPPVVVRPTPGGGLTYLFRFPATLKVALSVTATALVLSAGSGLLVLWLGEAWPFALIPAALAVLALIATAIVWTFKSRVVIEAGEIRVRKSVLGIPRFWRIPFAEVAGVQAKKELVEGVKEKDRDWELKIERRNGDEVDLGATIANRADAARLAAEIERLVRCP